MYRYYIFFKGHKRTKEQPLSIDFKQNGGFWLFKKKKEKRVKLVFKIHKQPVKCSGMTHLSGFKFLFIL